MYSLAAELRGLGSGPNHTGFKALERLQMAFNWERAKEALLTLLLPENGSPALQKA